MTADDDRTTRTLRDAADPALAAGAAERIAQGAWERAARARPAPRFRAWRRIAVPAAAAALFAAAAFAPRGTDAAFAVEGDPVMVRRGGQWVATRDVPVATLVRVPEGVRALVTREGDVLRPRPGSVFRCFAQEGGPRRHLRVAFDEGGADVAGAGVVVTLRDEVTMEPDASAASSLFSFALGDAGGATRFEVVAGRAALRVLRSDERLALGAAQKAALLPAARGGAGRRLARIEAWTPDAPTRLVRGGFSFEDADFDPLGGIRLVGDLRASGCVAFEVPASAVPDALSCVNLLSKLRVRVNVRASATASPPTRLVYENGATRVEAILDPAGGVVLVKGADVRRFQSVAAFRRDAPSDAALFGEELGRR